MFYFRKILHALSYREWWLVLKVLVLEVHSFSNLSSLHFVIKLLLFYLTCKNW